jgi:hypothetical protein
MAARDVRPGGEFSREFGEVPCEVLVSDAHREADGVGEEILGLRGLLGAAVEPWREVGEGFGQLAGRLMREAAGEH